MLPSPVTVLKTTDVCVATTCIPEDHRSGSSAASQPGTELYLQTKEKKMTCMHPLNFASNLVGELKI